MNILLWAEIYRHLFLENIQDAGEKMIIPIPIKQVQERNLINDTNFDFSPWFYLFLEAIEMKYRN